MLTVCVTHLRSRPLPHFWLASAIGEYADTWLAAQRGLASRRSVISGHLLIFKG